MRSREEGDCMQGRDFPFAETELDLSVEALPYLPLVPVEF